MFTFSKVRISAKVDFLLIGESVRKQYVSMSQPGSVLNIVVVFLNFTQISLSGITGDNRSRQWAAAAAQSRQALSLCWAPHRCLMNLAGMLTCIM